MKINKLELTNVRGFTYAKLDFQPGFNLIVGINGVGKTTVLESLRIVLAHILSEIKSPVITKENFQKSDININTNFLKVNTSFTIAEEAYDFIYSKSAKDFTTTVTEQKKRTLESDPNIREEGITLDDICEFIPALSGKKTKPEFGLYFSTRRSMIVNQTSKVVKSRLPYASAYIDSLSNTRAFNIKTLAEWFNVRNELAKLIPSQGRTIKLIQETIYKFLPGFSNLDLIVDEISGDLTFCITKSDKVLRFSQLSDGERGVLALVFEIARRLIVVYSDRKNPLEGEAIIIIDELDLHLHPKWQRTIVGDLTRTFPGCQFIATTHSPQIISSVLPENIQIINDLEVNHAFKSYGLDINWVLKFIMEDDDRLEKSKQAITEVEKLIEEVEFEKARQLIELYRKENLDLDEWVMFEARMSHLEMFGDEEDN